MAYLLCINFCEIFFLLKKYYDPFSFLNNFAKRFRVNAGIASQNFIIVFLSKFSIEYASTFIADSIEVIDIISSC